MSGFECKNLEYEVAHPTQSICKGNCSIIIVDKDRASGSAFEVCSLHHSGVELDT